MNQTSIIELYKKIFKHPDYMDRLEFSVIEANTMALQNTVQYLVKSKLNDNESVLNAIFTTFDLSHASYSLNFILDGVKNISVINTLFEKINFERIDEIVQAYVQTGLALHLIKEVSYPASVNLSWFFKHQVVYQSFGAYHHSIYRDYNKRLVKVSFLDPIKETETRPLKLIANINLSIVDDCLIPIVVLSLPFMTNKNRVEIAINLNESFDIQEYKTLFEDKFKQASIKGKTKKLPC
jgi:hypothetical protein